jgi:ribosomal subunit interface protein
MQSPLQLSVRNCSLTNRLEEAIRERAHKLDRYCDKIISCRVTIECPHRSQQKGSSYNVKINMSVPGEDLVVGREPHEDMEVAMREAFEAARRQLQDYAKRQRGEVKHRETPPPPEDDEE